MAQIVEDPPPEQAAPQISIDAPQNGNVISPTMGGLSCYGSTVNSAVPPAPATYSGYVVDVFACRLDANGVIIRPEIASMNVAVNDDGNWLGGTLIAPVGGWPPGQKVTIVATLKKLNGPGSPPTYVANGLAQVTIQVSN